SPDAGGRSGDREPVLPDARGGAGQGGAARCRPGISGNRGSGEMVLRRDDWLDLARKVDWAPRYVEERELFPEEISGRPWLTHDAWRDWNEVYRTTYREYV